MWLLPVFYVIISLIYFVYYMCKCITYFFIYLIWLIVENNQQPPPAYTFIKQVFWIVPITLLCGVFTTGYYETKVPFTYFMIMGVSYLGFVALFFLDCCSCCFECISITNNVIHTFTMAYNGILVLVAIAIDYYPPDFVFIIAILIPVMITYYYRFYENIDYYQVDYVINMQYIFVY